MTSSSRALGYLDGALPNAAKNLVAADIKALLSRFSNETYEMLTGIFGDPSDVDGDGRVIFLFTHLLDRVGGYTAGFYVAESLFSTDQGGDGKRADMMYLSPTRLLSFYNTLLAHEFQHLIDFNQHALVRNG